MRYHLEALKDTFLIYKEKNIILRAAFLTYLTVLNITPFFYFILFITSKIPFIHSQIPKMKKIVMDIIPGYSNEILSYFDVFMKNISNLAMLNSIIFSLSIISLVLAFFTSVEAILSKNKKSNPFTVLIFMLLFILLASLTISIVITVNILIPIFIPNIVNRIYVQILPFLIWFIVLSILFYLSKTKEIKIKSTLISSFSTTILIFGLKIILGLYFHFFSYNKIYGAVSIIPSLLLWLFFFWNILLLGVAFEKAINKKFT